MRSSNNTAPFVIGDWTAYPDTDQLQWGSESVTVEPRMMDLLVCLARHAGEVVSANVLVDEVWHGTIVSDAPLYQSLAKLRKVLRDDASDPRYIETVRKRGYRLVVPVSMLSDAAPPHIRSHIPRSRKWATPILSMLLACLSLLLGSSDDSMSRMQPRGWIFLIDSIAILPFVDMSENGGHQYLGDGIAEEIMHRIAADSSIRVVARTSSFAFRDRDVKVQQIGEALGADSVLEGSVRRSGDRVRVTAQLIDASDGYHIWSATYEHDVKDAFVLQDTIAASVAHALGIEDSASIGGRSWTQSPEAATAYYLGTYHMQKRRADSLELAVTYLREATEHDPQFALAYASLSWAYFLASEERYGRIDGEEASRLSTAALRQAEALDPDLPEVLDLLAGEAHAQGDLARAEALQLRAIEANPSNASAYKSYANILAADGRLEEALAARREAVTLDPLSPVLRVNLGQSYLSLHRFDKAEAEFRVAVELDPNWHIPYWLLARVLSYKGRLAESIEIATQGLAVEGSDARHSGSLAVGIAYYFLTLGDVEAAGRWLDRANELGVDGWPAANVRIHWLLAQDRFGDAHSLLSHWAREAPDEVNMYRLGGLYFATMSRNDDAVALFETILSLWRDEDDPPLVTRDFLHWGYLPALHLARLYRIGGEHDAANGLLGDCAEFLGDLDRRGFDSPGLHYVSASFHSLRGDRGAAIRSLRSAIDGGWSKLWFVERDPIFAEYRGNVEFEAILARLRSRLAAELQAAAAVASAE